MEIFKITFRISLMGPSQLIPVIDDELQQTTWLWKQTKKKCGNRQVLRSFTGS